MLTYLDIAKRSGSDTAVGLVDELNRYSPELNTLPVRPIVGTTFKTTKKIGGITGGFRGANEGNALTSVVYDQILSQCFFYEAPLQVDINVAKSDGSAISDLMTDQTTDGLASAASAIGTQFYYGTNADAKGFAGLRSLISSDVEVSAAGTGGSGSTSVYLVWENIKGTHLVAGNGLALDMSSPQWLMQQVSDSTDPDKKFTAYVNSIIGSIGLAFGHKYSAGRVKLVTDAAPFTDSLGAQLLSKFPVDIQRIGGLRWYMNRNAAFWLQRSRSTTQTVPNGGKSLNFAPMPTECAGIPITVTDSIATGSTIEQS
jgi:hypothetical protein